MTDFEGFEKLATQLKLLSASLDDAAGLIGLAMDSGVETTALQIEATARDKAPVDTGNLRSSISSQQAGLAEYNVGTNVEYAPDVEFGRGPVVADDAEALRFEIDGEVLYRKSVGPAPAQPFLRPALQQHKSDLVENIEEEIEKVMRKVFG